MNVEIFKKTVTVGRMTDGKINLTLTGPKESIDHRRLNWYHELTISGDIYYKNGRGLASCGQIESIDHRHELTISGDIYYKNGRGQINTTLHKEIEDLKPTKGTMMDRADRWHLNGMNAGCKHQDNYNYVEEYEQLADIETGYKYGSKWLVEPLPRAHI